MANSGLGRGSAPRQVARERGFIKVDGWIAWVTQPRPRVRTAMRWTLLLSAALHTAMTPFFPGLSRVDEQSMANLDTEYSRKISAKKSARYVADRVSQENRMPPPPPDPEAVVRKVQAESLTHDLEKVLDKGRLLDNKASDRITASVQENLKDELDTFAKDVAAGKLSKEEIEKRQADFTKNAHLLAVKALREYRVDTQAETAELSTTEWYERNVSRALFSNLVVLLGTPVGYRGIKSPEAWSRVFASSKDPHYSSGDLPCVEALDRKIQELDRLIRASDGKGKKNADWDRPSPEHAASVKESLQRIREGGAPAWRTLVFGDGLVPGAPGENGAPPPLRTFAGVLHELHPHRVADGRKAAEALERLWDKLAAEAAGYVNQTASGDSEEESKTRQKACHDALRELVSASNQFVNPHDANNLHLVNALTRVETLTGPVREKMYAYWSDTMVDGLQPIIKRFCEGQFSKGKLKDDKKFDEAMLEFPSKVIPLVRRDVEKLIPRKMFEGIVFMAGRTYRRYKNALGEMVVSPSPKDVENDAALLAELSAKNPALKAYADQRRKANALKFQESLAAMVEHVLQAILSDGLLMKGMGAFVEGVDYTDGVQEKFDARAAAMNGRRQDLANLTAGGVPDTSASKFALEFGASKGHGASLEPVTATLIPGYYCDYQPRFALRTSAAQLPGRPGPSGLEDVQFKPEKQPFADSPQYECIPFLARMPRLDGDLSEWPKLRPLILRRVKEQPTVLLYAGWNYQGFFFAYEVKQADSKYYYPVASREPSNVTWPLAGDHLRLCFDTLDARNANRGEPHTQEFIVFPRGTDSDPGIPGAERVISSQRDAVKKEYRSVNAHVTAFAQQPPPENGPDGSGPYRVTQFTPTGYCVEVFLPRSKFKHPVFAPGWHIGFDCAIGMGFQSPKKGSGAQYWASGNPDMPRSWGDLLLLGTDAHVVLQEASREGALTEGIIPGRSYLLTVVDADRNVNPTTEDTILASAEVRGGREDVEVYILKETAKNSGIFRGYINTQPGVGREVQSALEVMPGNEVRIGYVDFANTKGQRHVVKEILVPVVHNVMVPQFGVREAGHAPN